MSSFSTSPLAGYENAAPLPDTLDSYGRLHSLPAPQSEVYNAFPEPFLKDENGFDFHVYFIQSVPSEVKYARELHERIRREFPEMRVSVVFEKPVGPHPTGMFEVETLTTHQTGVLFTFLTIWRGALSVLVHPNTNDTYKDHTELNSWMGKPWPLYAEMLKEHSTEALNKMKRAPVKDM